MFIKTIEGVDQTPVSYLPKYDLIDGNNVPIRAYYNRGDDITVYEWRFEAPQKTLEQIKLEAVKRVHSMHSQMLSLVTGDATAEERDTWAEKAIEARLVIAGETDVNKFPMLKAESDITGESLADIATSVNAKAIKFAEYSGIASGLRKATIVGVNSATNEQGVEEAMNASEQQMNTIMAGI